VEHAGAGVENPIWTFGDVVIVTLATVAFFVLFALLSPLVATMLPAFRNMDLHDVSQSLGVALVAQFLTYIAVIVLVARLVRHRATALHRYLDVWGVLRWNVPKVDRRALFVGIGAGLALLVQFTGRFLPIPPSLPIEQEFNSTSSAYFMAAFGIAVAPLFEEIYFRGLMYPVLVRGFHRAGNTMGTAFAVTITAACFAAIHANQVRFAWAPLLVIFFVGLVLTLVRAHTRSLASSWLVHVGYNTMLFLLLFLQTSGFRDFR
jgi:hypothetical protein